MTHQQEKTVVCPECLKPYEVIQDRKISRMCSDECYNSHRRKKYIADEEKRQAKCAKTKAYKAENKEKVAAWKLVEKEKRRANAAKINPIRKAEREAARVKRNEMRKSIENELARMGRKRSYAAKAEELDLFLWAKRQYAKARFAEKMKDEEARKAKIEYVKRWKANNPERHKAWTKEYMSRPENKLILLIRSRMADLIGQCVSGSVTADVRSSIGCSTQFLKQHIESMFHSGMQWDNHGTLWHVDHLIPLAAAEKDSEVAMSLNHWTNLHPMIAERNLRKGGSRDWSATFYAPSREGSRN